LTVVANIIFLLYLVVFVSAQPSPPLVGAVGFELVVFFCLIGYRHWRGQTKGWQQADSALQSIEDNHKSVYVIRRTLAAASMAILAAICLYAGVDLTALVLARFGKPEWSKPIYLAIAPPLALGIHPAFSMELLAGAEIDAAKLATAEPLLSSLLAIRTDFAGAHSELTAAMYANLGDYYRKFRRNKEAERYYQRSIALSKDLNLPQGYGSPMTKLAALLRDEHRFAESQQCFTDALTVRTRIFGKDSQKVAETLLENAVLLQAENRPGPAQEMKDYADNILHRRHSDSTTRGAAAIPLVVLVLSIVFLSQRNRLIVFAAEWSNRRRSATNG
jgi:hypothetical protein